MNVPRPVWLTMLVLVLVHLLVNFGGFEIQAWSNFLLPFYPSRFDSVLRTAGYPVLKISSFFTYSLLHANLAHLLANLVWLLIFGTPVARRLSGLKFMAIMAAGSVGGGLATLAQFYFDHAFIILVGASAAVAALMAAATPIMFGSGSIFSRTATDHGARLAAVLPLYDLLQNRQAMIFIAVFIGLQLFTGVAQFNDGVALLGQSNIAWQAHLGGFMAGLLVFYAIDRSAVPTGAKL